MRIAMWSGPRNISTALMRSWGNRDDTFVTDEPLYAHYLAATGLEHPGRQETLAAHSSDWRAVVDWLTGPIPSGRRIWYQKHMAHHLLPMIDRGWLGQLSHCFLIRDPREMLASLVQFVPQPTLADTGLVQQVELFEEVRQRAGEPPPVINGRDVASDPRGILSSLCRRLGVDFQDAMLRWPAGGRATDGAWAPFWYDKVNASTTFAPPDRAPAAIPDRLADLYQACRPYYDSLAEHCLLSPSVSRASNV
jgi:hypothetical protein